MTVTIHPSDPEAMPHQRAVTIEQFSDEMVADHAVVLALDALHAFGYSMANLLQSCRHIGNLGHPPDGVGVVSN